MKLTQTLKIQVLWLGMLVSFLPAKAQSPKAAATDTLKTILADTAATNLNAAAQDTIYPGQKKPFTESQLREGSNKRFLTRAVLPATALIGVGIYTIQGNGFYSSFDARDQRFKSFPNFSTSLDDYLLLIPAAYMYGFNAFSSQNRHDIRRQTGLLLASGVLTTAIVFPVKKLTDIDRPNGHPTAFPSGHTAYAFTIATLVDKEFRHKSPWISVGSYTIASATGVMRVLNNAHWMADVLAGAGVGILSTNTVYWLHDKLFRDKGLNTTFVPTVLPNGSPGMGLVVQF